MKRRMQVDVEALDDRTKRDWAAMPHWASAERLGRAEAFKDLEEHGFAYAHDWAERTQGSRDLMDTMQNKTWAFMNAYREVVLGFWMAMSPEGIDMN